MEPRPSFLLSDTTIKPTKAHKFIRVVFDQELRWRAQVEQAIAKATKWALAMCWLARPAVGISPRQMHQLYQVVAMPSFTYTTDIWIMPVCRATGDEKFKGSVGVVCKLTMVQHMASMAITGALRTSASDTMEVHANLLPLELLLNKVCHRATLQLVALPETHPLFKPVQQSAGRLIKRHQSPLHHLFHAFNMQPSDCEMIAPMICPPNEDSAVQLRITNLCEESKEADAEDKADIHVYSDGSGIEGMAGAAAVLFCDSWEAMSLRYQLGLLTWHTTYDAEVVGVLLVLELIRRESTGHSATIRLDNQAIIQALGGCSTKPAQALLNLIHEGCADWLTSNRCGSRLGVWT